MSHCRRRRPRMPRTAAPISGAIVATRDRKSTRLNSSHPSISYAVFCLKKKKITIRGVSSWNGSEPLILVDGVERTMKGIDINSVVTLSVLKDYSATSSFAWRGANGVILITTKRGEEGKANVDINVSTTMKTYSKLPDLMDSYDALSLFFF